jgi:hypothetical protein
MSDCQSRPARLHGSNGHPSKLSKGLTDERGARNEGDSYAQVDHDRGIPGSPGLRPGRLRQRFRPPLRTRAAAAVRVRRAWARLRTELSSLLVRRSLHRDSRPCTRAGLRPCSAGGPLDRLPRWRHAPARPERGAGPSPGACTRSHSTCPGQPPAPEGCRGRACTRSRLRLRFRPAGQQVAGHRQGPRSRAGMRARFCRRPLVGPLLTQRSAFRTGSVAPIPCGLPDVPLPFVLLPPPVRISHA